MLTLPPSVHIYMATEPVDLRRGHDGLYAIVRNQWRMAPFAGHLFAFVGCRGNRIKILFWDRGGFVIYYKRLEKAASAFRASARGRPGSLSMRPSSACCSMASTSSTFVAPSTGPRPRPMRPPGIDDMDLRFAAVLAPMDGQATRDVINARSCRPSTSAVGARAPRN